MLRSLKTALESGRELKEKMGTEGIDLAQKNFAIEEAPPKAEKLEERLFLQK